MNKDPDAIENVLSANTGAEREACGCSHGIGPAATAYWGLGSALTEVFKSWHAHLYSRGFH